MKMTPEEILKSTEFLEWYNSRPDVIKKMIDKFPPTKLYRVQKGAYPGNIVSYNEDGTFRVNINSPFFPRIVFGLKPDDLEEWVEDKEPNT